MARPLRIGVPGGACQVTRRGLERRAYAQDLEERLQRPSEVPFAGVVASTLLGSEGSVTRKRDLYTTSRADLLVLSLR